MSDQKALAQMWADRLAPLGPIEVRAMFGSYALRIDAVTFACFFASDFSLRGDAAHRSAWEAMGGRQFTYTTKKTGKTSSMPYWQFANADNWPMETVIKMGRTALEIARAAKK